MQFLCEDKDICRFSDLHWCTFNIFTIIQQNAILKCLKAFKQLCKTREINRKTIKVVVQNKTQCITNESLRNQVTIY